jgi:[glutamine synthetase] adenylyltransferase / [glutamine synthetase]-adenylyl-L-tyrosine phosphorylase
LLTEMLIAIRLLAPETANPGPESCELMAKACGAASWSELVERHDEARRNVRRLWDRIQEGKVE